MVKFRNRLTGSIMWVADDRVEEYKKLGHKMVTDTISEKPAETAVKEETEKPLEKTPRKRKK